MAYELRLPDLGEGVTEGEISSWLVEAGQTVAEDDPLVEVETDKATVDVPCPVDGVVETIHVAEGERVPVGTMLISIATGATAGGVDTAEPGQTATPAPPSNGAASPRTTVKATPGARRLARDLGVDLAALAGSGPGGAIGERDVRAATGGRREPLRGVRRRIAERLTKSHREIPKVTVVEECDFTALQATRGDRSHVAYTVRACVDALREFPEFNATLEADDVLAFHDRYDVGVAAQGPHGLTVPVLRGADTRTLDELDAEARRLAQAVRDDTIAPEELRGSTFTVTLAGKLGGYFATPLVNPGEAAILGVHRIAPRPVVREGEIVVREIGLVSCSFDHRIADGSRATQFLLHVIEALERAE